MMDGTTLGWCAIGTPRRLMWLMVGFCTVLASLNTQAGTLRLGKPVVSANQYTFPVVLQGNADDVAALDFRLAYDPAVFSPVGAQSGRSALQAQKQVSSNVSAPGEFVVVLMGFNQNTVSPGEVVEVVLEKIGEPSDGNTVLRIAEPTLATNVGVEVDSRGSGRTVRFGEAPKEGEGDEDSPTDDDTEPLASEDKAPSEPNVAGDVARHGPLFVTRADDRVPVAGRTGPDSGVAKRQPGDASVVSNGGTAVPGGAIVTPTTGGTTVPIASHGVATTAKPTQHAGIDGEIQQEKGKDLNSSSSAQPVADEELTEIKSVANKEIEKKGRQEGGNYATLLLFATGVPLGLVILMRLASR